MSPPLDTLNYASLLQLPDRVALVSALSQARTLDFQALMDKYTVTLGVPSALLGAGETAVQVDLISTDVRQYEGAGALRYYRLDLGDYLGCCQRYVVDDDLASSGTLANWFITHHGVYFDQPNLSIGAPTVDPEQADRQLVVITVAEGNYVWQGQATLWLVAASHLGLWAKPGVSTGIRWEDVGLSPRP